jgi:hypothetical protein
LAALFAIGTKPVERDLGVEDLVTRDLLKFLDRGRVEIRISIDDLVALDTDQVRVGFRTVAIIVTVVAQVDLQHLAHVLEQRQRLVHRGMAHGGELALDPGIELSCAGMSFARRDQPHQFDPLRGQPEIAFFQRSNQLVKSDFWIGHSGHFLIKILYG